MITTPFTVIIGGNDVTDRFLPLVKTLDINRTASGAYDTANIVLADPYGKTVFPRDRDPIEISIRGQWAFSGFVSDPSLSVDKGSGREITVSANSVDLGSKVKEPQLRSKDSTHIKDVAGEWGKAVGLDVQFSGDIAGIKRDYWLQQNESFMSWGYRIAREIGATFKILGNRAFFTERNSGLSITGKPLNPVFITGGVNLIAASGIKPNVGRPKYKDVEIEYYDVATGKREKVNVPTNIPNVEATLRKVISAATKEQAEEEAKSGAKEAERNTGQGTFSILGSIAVEPEAEATVSGCRPGIDGKYRADDVSLKISKGGGFVVDISVREPKGGAGVDTR